MAEEFISRDPVGWAMKRMRTGGIFYKFPKSLIEDERVNKISNDAKILYMLFIHRLALSQMNGWVDQEGEVYIYYSVKNMCEDLHCHTQKVAKLLDELEFDAGLIRRKHQGQGRPNRIYPKLLEAAYPQEV